MNSTNACLLYHDDDAGGYDDDCECLIDRDIQLTGVAEHVQNLEEKKKKKKEKMCCSNV